MLLFPVNPLNPPLNLLYEGILSGVDDIDDRVGAIGEVVQLSVRIDPTDVEDIHFPGGIRGATRDRDGREQPDCPLIPPIPAIFSIVAIVRADGYGPE